MIKFWPAPTGIPVEICKHRYNAPCTISEQTDTVVASSLYAMEAFGFKNNTRLGAFISHINNPSGLDMTEVEKTGMVKSDIYLSTDFWKNPVNGNFEIVPDYYASAWTVLGATYFDVSIGDPIVAPTPTRFPACGRDMFAISTGDLGFDDVTKEFGDSNLEELYGLVDKQVLETKNQIKKEPSAFSYRNGRTEFKDFMYQKSLGNRNSAVVYSGDSDTFYGIFGGSDLGHRTVTTQPLREYFASYPSSDRFWDHYLSVGQTAANARLTSEIGKTITNNGWFRDFTHWHFAETADVLDIMDSALATMRIAASTAHFCNNGEALEYMYLRQLAKRVIAKEKDQKVTVIVDVVDFYKEVQDSNDLLETTPLKCLNTPLTIKVDLTGTYLAGKSIKTSFGNPISLGSNQFLIEVPFNSEVEAFATVVISEAAADYVTLSQPSVSKSISGTNVLISSGTKVKTVLFQAESGMELKDVTVISRGQEFNENHNITFDPTKESWVGVISRTGKSNLIKI